LALRAKNAPEDGRFPCKSKRGMLRLFL
jgi:hypothetical protein